MAEQYGTAVATLYITAGCLIGLAIYFLPTWFAGRRNAEHYWYIALANLVVGVTGLGWLAVLIWAVNAKPRAPRGEALPRLAAGQQYLT